MLRIMQAMAVALALGVLAVYCPAQAQQGQEPGAGAGEAADTREADEAASPRPVVDAYFSRDLFEVERILNRRVLGSAGEPVAEVSTVLVDPDTGRMAYAVLSRERDSGRARVLVPYEALGFSREQREYELRDNGFAVGLAPEYTARSGVHTREQFQAAYGRQLTKAWQEGRMAARVEPATPEREAAARDEAAQGQEAGRPADQADQAEQTRQDQQPGQGGQASGMDFRNGLVELDRLRNRPLMSRDGDEIGTLDTLLVDPAEGGVRVAVIEEGGFLGLGENVRAVPWSKVLFNWQEVALILDMSQEELAQAPQVDPTRRRVVFDTPPDGYEQFIFLEQQGRRAEEPGRPE